MKLIKKIIYLFFCLYSILFGIGVLFLVKEYTFEDTFMKYYLVFLCTVSGIFYGYFFRNEMSNLR